MTSPAMGNLSGYPETQALVRDVLDVWPDHEDYLARSMGARSDGQMATTEEVAAATRRLIAGRERHFAEGYKWTCDQLRQEELFFHREGRYRLATFADAEAEVYSRPEYMEPYVSGLLLTQALWYNHLGTFDMFLDRVLRPTREPFDYLEIGPGHGLAVFFAAQHPHVRSVAAWDVSATSLAETRKALDTLGVSKPVDLTEVDILSAAEPDQQYDLIVISEVLEHLEQPQTAVRFLKTALKPGGRLFVNVPINSPSPDHIYLFSTPDEVSALVEAAGLTIEASELYATQARPIEKAIKNRISVSVGLTARAA
ncbi:class I SAM-dependent methyltransferase [Sphingomonas changbaiensis]|nr:class I SAM-dependent methyltransferase [Sphingomonas changbaiensis]